jgi:ParB-like chromosome segregation protein Spo0J
MAKKRGGAAVAEALRVINHHYEPDCPLDSLELHPDNPRQADCGAIHESVEHNGFYGAIIAQLSTRTVLAGKHRYITASQLGAKTIPTMWVDVDDATALKIELAAFRIALPTTTTSWPASWINFASRTIGWAPVGTKKPIRTY